MKRALAGLALVGLLSTPAPAMMAGAAPDSPAARVDASHVDSPWAGVVALRTAKGIYSGVAVSPRHILTAAHVAGGPVPEMRIVVNAGGEAPVQLGVARADIFPGYAYPADDLALLTLAETLPAGVPTYPINDLPAEAGVTRLILVGYGASGQGDKGVNTGSNASLRRVGENMLDLLTPRVDSSGRQSNFYLYDFDGPEGNGSLGGPSLGNALETMVGGGDSGSPAFSLLKGYRAVTGINTFATPLNSGRALDFGFGQGGGGILLSEPRFIAWLQETSGHEIRLLSQLQELTQRDYPLPLIAGSVFASGIAGLYWWQRRRG